MLEVLRFEIRYLLRRPATYTYFLVLFVLAFFYISTDVVSITGGSNKVDLNAPVNLALATGLFSFIGIIITTALAGTAIIRDFSTKSYELFYTTPITKFAYLGGRFFGVLLVMLLVYAGISLGLLIGSYMPWAEAERMGAFNLISYLNAYMIFALPNVIFMTGMFFAVGTLSRSVFLVYIAGIIFLIANSISGVLLSDIENETLSGLMDPTGLQAFSLTTRYWTPDERNLMQVPWSELIIQNRLIWLGIGLGFFALTYAVFSFNVQPFRLIPTNKKAKQGPTILLETFRPIVLPKVKLHFDLMAQWEKFHSLVVFYSKSIFTEIPFLAITVIGLANFLTAAAFSDSLFGTKVYPVTHIMLSSFAGFGLFFFILGTVYAGELLNKERGLQLHLTFDALPIATPLVIIGKFIAYIFAVLALYLVLILGSIGVQAFKGYFNFELGLYFFDAFAIQFPEILLLTSLIFAIHAVVGQKFIGHIIVVVYFVVNGALSEIGLEHPLFRYLFTPGVTYSDLNGYGDFLYRFFVYLSHWAIVSGLFWVVMFIAQNRGAEDDWRARLHATGNRFQIRYLTPTGIIVLLMLLSGGFIYYNVNVLGDYRSSDAAEKLRVDYEKKYKHLSQLTLPRTYDAYIEADLVPENSTYRIQGRLKARNTSQNPIDSLLLNFNQNAAFDKLEFSHPNKTLLTDSVFGLRLVQFTPALQPGDSLTFTFDFRNDPKGFDVSTGIVGNGTFLNSGILPSFGYNAGGELSSDTDRKKYDLAPKARTNDLNDSTAYQNNYISSDADWITFETIVSTAPKQIAIAPGYLQKEWEENGRRYFHYKMDAPILNFYSFLSADYTVTKDEWKGVAIEIYHQPEHSYNVEGMIESLKASFEYFTKNFGPYQHRQVRILEFPRYASFAQSFPNTIPYSESIGFIAKVEEDAIDYPYYVTAHELAHQWWAHQVIGANVQGATMLSETFSQYSALMVMKQKMGEEKMSRFLRYELNNYLQGRAGESKKELPLIRNENQQYIHYRKGSLIMYALQDYLGEELVNKSLSNFVSDYGFQAAPYPTSQTYIDKYLEPIVPDTMKYLIDDWFREITLYDNRAEAVTFVKENDSTYVVSLKTVSKKLKADTLGTETEIPVADWIDFGVFGGKSGDVGENGEPLYVGRHKIWSDTTLQVTVHKRPARGGIDPYYKLIDRIPGDNLKPAVMSENTAQQE